MGILANVGTKKIILMGVDRPIKVGSASLGVCNPPKPRAAFNLPAGIFPLRLDLIPYCRILEIVGMLFPVFLEKRKVKFVGPRIDVLLGFYIAT
jgi:hypothetical protein